MIGDRDLFGDEDAGSAPAPRFGRRVFLAAPVRARAEAMRRDGASLEVIAAELGIAVETVRLRLANELERGLPGGRGQGRPRWTPTPEQRAEVVRMVAAGVGVGRIAQAVGVSTPTLRLHCAAELRGRD
jgi:DNA-binding NarL/FixJ family response regulator